MAQTLRTDREHLKYLSHPFYNSLIEIHLIEDFLSSTYIVCSLQISLKLLMWFIKSSSLFGFRTKGMLALM